MDAAAALCTQLALFDGVLEPIQVRILACPLPVPLEGLRGQTRLEPAPSGVHSVHCQPSLN